MNARQQFFYESLNQIQNTLFTGYENLMLVARNLQQSFQQYVSIAPRTFPCHYSEETHNIDNEAREIYPVDAPSNLIPVTVIGDGNCLFRSFSVLIFGNESHHIELRARASVELICNIEYYINEECLFHSNSGQALFWIAHYSSSAADSYLNMNVASNQLTVLWNCIRQGIVLNSWVGMWHICALASVTQSCVRSIYPAEEVQVNCTSQVRNVLNITIYPRIQNAFLGSSSVMWSRVGEYHGLWQPNHFVPCLENLQQDTSAPANEPVQPFTDNKNKYKTTACTNAILTNHTYPKPRAKQSNPPQVQHKCHLPTNTDHFDANSVTQQKQNNKREKKECILSKQKSKGISRRKIFTA